MTMKEYETLKIGDIVSPVHGKNKGQKAVVVSIWDVTDQHEWCKGYREILISANFVDKALRVNDINCDIDISYKKLHKLKGA